MSTAVHAHERTGRHAAPGARHVRRRTPVLTVVAAVVALLVGSGSAYAYWTTAGTGAGSAATGAALPVTLLTANAGVSTRLVPGGTADLSITVSNPNPWPVTITGVAQAAGSITVSGASGTCTTTGVTVPTANALSINVASGASVDVTVPSGAAMSTASQSGCQGASFRIPVALVVRR